MKIRKISTDQRHKIYGMFRKRFSGSKSELSVLQKLHQNNRLLYEWACIHTNKSIGYIAFSNAYNAREVCGLHLIHLIVNPEFQGRGISDELLSFALRQKEIQRNAIYVHGDSHYYSRFGFEPVSNPSCPFVVKGKQFLGIRNQTSSNFMISYEPEYKY